MVKESLQNSLPSAIRNERKRGRLTQWKLAKMAGVSVPTIRQIERGLGRLSSLQRVLQALDLELTGRNLPPGTTFGERLSALRKRKGLSQRKLAELIHVSPPTIIALETSGKGLLKTALKVLTALGAGATIVSRGEKPSFYTQAGNSSAHHGWSTPKELLHRLYKAVGTFDLDPCSPTVSCRCAPVRAKMYFTVEDNGLMLPWYGTVFVNPPYGRSIANWVTKSRNEVQEGRANMVIALVPARTDTKWWHKDIAGIADVFLLQGRLRFGENGQSAPFPSALVIWGADEKTLARLRNKLAEAWYVPRDITT